MQECMCNLAEGDLVDKLVDVTHPLDLEELIKTCSEKYFLYTEF